MDFESKRVAGMRNTTLWQFENTDAFADHMRDIARLHSASRYVRGGRDSWSGGDWSDAMRIITSGDSQENCRSVEKLIDEVEDKLPVTDGVMPWATDLVGYIPHVPNVLIGVPDSMLRPNLEADSVRAPVRLFVDIGASGGFSSDQMRKRGAAIAALAVKIGQSRPVELFALSTLKDSSGPITSIVTVNLGVAPLNVPLVTAALTNPLTFRRLMFAQLHAVGSNKGSVRWAWSSGPHKDDYQEKIRKVLNLTDNDILIKAGHLTDDLVLKPVKWVEAQLREIAPEQFAA